MTNSINVLIMKTMDAERRLEQLERRGESIAGSEARVVKTVLAELKTSIDALRVASEQLHSLADELALARQEGRAMAAEYAEFRELLPVPCIVTDESGLVESANAVASELLNVSQRHLMGKPLALFVTDRAKFFQIVADVRAAGGPARAELTIRPRERKPRSFAVQVTRLTGCSRWCWFFQADRTLAFAKERDVSTGPQT
jgi:PAS domain-containing protein